ncbi:MAG: (2Fe-2S)-binding protein [Kosmotogaceae bacterium]|nr:(2Fe-2S)-binding protein [Kosmotogaceae bacterium]
MKDKRVTITLNGRKTILVVEDRTTLLNALREHGVTSLKRGCEEGECGACTLIMNGLPQKSCLILAREAEGADILTVEGLVKKGRLHPIQQAFIDEGAIQCGYCTPGMVMTTYALLKKNPYPSDEEIREALTGNICRCTGYLAIIRAVKKSAAILSGNNGGGGTREDY